MMRILPAWYGKSEEKLNRLILDIAIDNNIKFNFVMDSSTIKESVSAILNTLVNIQENAYPEIEQKQFEELDKLVKKLKFKKGKKKK